MVLVPTSITKPETFILESLNLDDENNTRLDGRVLFDVLRLQGKKPIYYYFRTQAELIKFSEIFRDSGYRYLHLSCHGDNENISLTFGNCSYATFAEIFKKKLNNRRVFVSGCSLGNRDFAEALFNENGGMYSLTAPQKKVYFSQTSSFWPAFYYMMHGWDSTAMKKKRLNHVLETLTSVFEMPLAHYFKNTAKNAIIDEVLFSNSVNKLPNALAKSSPTLPGDNIS